jgi:hypothetical protein
LCIIDNICKLTAAANATPFAAPAAVVAIAEEIHEIENDENQKPLVNRNTFVSPLTEQKKPFSRENGGKIQGNLNGKLNNVNTHEGKITLTTLLGKEVVIEGVKEVEEVEEVENDEDVIPIRGAVESRRRSSAMNQENLKKQYEKQEYEKKQSNRTNTTCITNDRSSTNSDLSNLRNSVSSNPNNPFGKVVRDSNSTGPILTRKVSISDFDDDGSMSYVYVTSDSSLNTTATAVKKTIIKNNVRQ